jgi:hypothetical protein
MTPWTDANDPYSFHQGRITCRVRGEFFIKRKRASAISTVLSALIIFGMTSLTEHRLLRNVIGILWGGIALVNN